MDFELSEEQALLRKTVREFAEAERAGRRARWDKAWVPLSQISRNLIHAVITAEDGRFFGHEGVDWKAIEESIEKNVEKGKFARGGSSITQQLAKNLYFGTRKTLARKARELVVTRWMEADLSKARILALLHEAGPGGAGRREVPDPGPGRQAEPHPGGERREQEDESEGEVQGEAAHAGGGIP
jgi:hypothetical protein